MHLIKERVILINYKKIIKEVRDITLTIIGSIVIVSVVNTEVLASAKVQQSSMENTLFNDDKLIVDKFSYNLKKTERGDIIIFIDNEEKGNILQESFDYFKNMFSMDSNDDKQRLVKRVVGVAGDEIDIRNGNVYLNGEKLEEEYIKGNTYSRDISFPIKVEKDKVFVLGDNREVSKDSRDFGVVNVNQIEGKVIFRVKPLDKIGLIK